MLFIMSGRLVKHKREVRLILGTALLAQPQGHHCSTLLQFNEFPKHSSAHTVSDSE